MRRALLHGLVKTSLFAMRISNLLNPSKRGRSWVRNHFRRFVFTQYFRFALLPALKNFSTAAAAKATKSPDTIWQIWAQGEASAPPIVAQCFASAAAHKGTLGHKILDAAALENLTDIPPVVWKKYRAGKIGEAHFSDIARLALLAKYGGVWADATCFFTAEISPDILAADFFMFQKSARGAYGHFFVQNCFIRAKAGNYLARAWYFLICEYWSREVCALDYFMHQIIFRALVMYDARACSEWRRIPKKDQDATHAAHLLIAKPFDRDAWNTASSRSFFQKLVHSWHKIHHPKGMPPDGTLFDAVGRGLLSQ